MTQLLFPAPPVSTVTVRGRTERIPIRRIFCVGRNYEAHAREMGVAVDREAPFYFTKAAEHYETRRSHRRLNRWRRNHRTHHRRAAIVPTYGSPEETDAE